MPAQPGALPQLPAGDAERPLLAPSRDRDAEVLFGDCVLGEDRRRARDLDLQIRRRCPRSDLLPLGEVAVDALEVAVAPYRSVGEVGEHPAAVEPMERSAFVVEDPNEVLVRLPKPLSGERQPA